MNGFPTDLVLPIPREKLLHVGESVLARRKGTNQPHKGLDLYAPVGTPVLAAQGGRVLRVVKGTTSSQRSQQRAGWFVDVLGEDSFIYRYLHLGADLRVKRDQFLLAGEQIGTVGDRATSGIKRAKPHLHFEICRGDYVAERRDYGERIDPKTVLPLGSVAMDWKDILSKAVEVIGPVAGGIVGGVAGGPAGAGVGAAVGGAAGKLLDQYVVQPYVPGEAAPPASVATAPPPASVTTAPPQPATPVAAAPQSQKDIHPSDLEAARVLLMSKGWSEQQAEQALQGQAQTAGPRSPLLALQQKGVTHEEAAHVVHGVLNEAGWHPEARQAILQGPYAFADYMRPAQHVPDAQMIARMRRHNHDAIMQANLHYTTERGGHSPQLYHGTDEGQVAGLGETTEHPGTEET